MSAKKQSSAKQKQTRAKQKLSRGESVEVARSGGESASGEALPEGWAWASADEFRAHDAPIIYGILQPGPEQEDGVYYVRPTEIVNDQIQVTNLRKTTQAIAEKYRRAALKGGDTLLSIVGTIGKVAEVPPSLEGANITQSSVRIRTNPECIEGAYLRYALKAPHITQQFDKHRLGTGVPRLNVGHVRELQFKLAPEAEQSRIVSAIESLQERSSRVRVLLSEVGPLIGQLRQSVLRGAFSGRLTADWRASNSAVEPASELLLRIRTERRERWEEAKLAEYAAKGKEPPKGWEKRYKEPDSVDQSKFAELPEGWCWVTIDQISNRVSDGVHKKPNYVEAGVPFLRVKNLTAGPGISFEETTFITQEDHEDFIRRTHPEKGDVLVTKDGTLGVIRLIDVETVFSIFVSLALIKPVDKRLGPFIAGALESPHGQAGMKATGSGLQHIHLVDLRATIIPLAPPAEQEEIIRLVGEAMERIDELESGLASMESSLTQLDQSILSKAFRGELVPQDPRDEPASELLARIRTTREKLEAEKKAKKKVTKKRKTKTSTKPSKKGA